MDSLFLGQTVGSMKGDIGCHSIPLMLEEPSFEHANQNRPCIQQDASKGAARSCNALVRAAVSFPSWPAAIEAFRPFWSMSLKNNVQRSRAIHPHAARTPARQRLRDARLQSDWQGKLVGRCHRDASGRREREATGDTLSSADWPNGAGAKHAHSGWHSRRLPLRAGASRRALPSFGLP